MHTITPIQLHDLINSAEDTPFLLDVREPNEFEYCHITGSQLMPMHSIPANIDQLPKNRPIVTICHHGMRSMQVAQFLLQNEFSDITNLTGGVHAWAQSVDSSMPTY
ncbi:MAG: rhodanese [Cycloclasticus sp. symbiont of Bathymodiolus heckerae]|nr:MAG: rhodanese [Cycloclasticus sp. symbiont of Bathymodiolus heckerae]